jgi:hypothetical protein
LSVELQDRIVSRHKSGEGYQNISAALKVAKDTVASIILKWKTFETTNPEKSGEKGLGQGGDQEPDVHSDRAPEFLCIDGRTRKTTIPAALHQPGLYGRVARQKPLLSKRHMTTPLEVCQKATKGLSDHEK